jgi:hypothetical protein
MTKEVKHVKLDLIFTHLNFETFITIILVLFLFY